MSTPRPRTRRSVPGPAAAPAVRKAGPDRRREEHAGDQVDAGAPPARAFVQRALEGVALASARAAPARSAIAASAARAGVVAAAARIAAVAAVARGTVVRSFAAGAIVGAAVVGFSGATVVATARVDAPLTEGGELLGPLRTKMQVIQLITHLGSLLYLAFVASLCGWIRTHGLFGARIFCYRQRSLHVSLVVGDRFFARRTMNSRCRRSARRASSAPASRAGRARATCAPTSTSASTRRPTSTRR